jgi:glyoxylase-like metal-dependent hydrolase (beta-lactamase superfamily II)
MRRYAKLIALLAAPAVFLVAVLAKPDDKPPEMKFNDVKELAPGVYFRYSSISATDPKVPFGGSNHTWIIFKDHVVVIDANFPQGAEEVIAAIKKTTDKPIKYVLDTHHHGDHAYGNAVWAKEGAKIIAHKTCARLLQLHGEEGWKGAAKDRPDVAKSELKQVDTTFDDKLVLEDDTQRVEFIFLGHAHTAGDAVAYLPNQKILCTGDACVNGAFNFMGPSTSGSWIKVLDHMKALDVKLVCPGHGPLAGRELFDKQQKYFVDMRKHVREGVDAGKQLDEITKTLDLPWYKEWTGKDAKEIKDNVEHVYKEMTGKIKYDELGFAPGGRGRWPDAANDAGIGGGR